MIAVLAGGVGAARLLSGLVAVVDPASLTAVVNTGDDLELYGLHISPDLDTVTYTLAGVVNPETGWGRADERFVVAEGLERYLGEPPWFTLGDRDLATHLYRTGRLRAGLTLSAVTAELAAAWGIGARLLPMTDDAVRTRVSLVGGETVDFQEYFVHRRHDVAVGGVAYVGATAAVPGPGVLDAMAVAEVVVLAPSNPILSIGPILALGGVRDLLAARRDSVVAVSPIVGGKALKGPAGRLLEELGHESSALGVARLWCEVAATLVIDEVDEALVAPIEALGMRAVVTETVMATPARAAALGRAVLEAGRRG